MKVLIRDSYHNKLTVHLAFIYVDDVRVMDGRHDLNLPPDSYEICFRLDFRLLDRLDGHLKYFKSTSTSKVM